jgi:hypothetical protein
MSRGAIGAAVIALALAAAACGRYGPPQRAPLATNPPPKAATTPATGSPSTATPAAPTAPGPTDMQDDDDDSEPPAEPDP